MTKNSHPLESYFLNQHLVESLDLVLEEARQDRCRYFTVEHLILALLDDPVVLDIFKAAGIRVQTVQEPIETYLRKTVPPLSHNQSIQPTLGVQRILRNAVRRAVGRATLGYLQHEKGEEVIREHLQKGNVILEGGAEASDVLVSIFEETGSFGVHLLESMELTQDRVVQYLREGNFNEERGARATGASQVGLAFDTGSFPSAAGPMPSLDLSVSSGDLSALKKYAVNLNEKARAGMIEPVIGRDEELQQVIQVLSRRRKNNPLLIGEPGVGKTAIAEGLAKAIVDKKVPRKLFHSVIYSLDVGALMAGTKMRGDFEERITGIIDALVSNPYAILFIDEIHTIIGAGAASGSSIDISNLLKPMLASGELKCIGATTNDEYRQIFEKDKALSRRFQKIDVPEPSSEETLMILRGIKRRFERHHNVQYTDEALEAAVELSKRYITNRFLPDKAIDVMDEAGANHAMSRKGIGTPVTLDDVAAVVSKITKIPVHNMSKSDKLMLATLEDDLKAVIFGQDPAISILVSAIKLARSGLREENKPIGSFLFAGPTGVGKTEVAKQLAKISNTKLLRFDMSEYSEPYSVSKLIGSSAGYVGYKEGGVLTNQVMENPHSIVLLDEIEKSHHSIYNVLLQVMDNGFLTDGSGRQIDFRHTIVIMTTNAGAGVESRRAVGFTTERDTQTEKAAELARIFTPEFRNRLDAVIQFKPLSAEIVGDIVDKELKELQGQLTKQQVTLEIDPKATQWLAEKGYDPAMGARPLKRLIEDQIKRPLADELLFGRLAKGGNVRISVENNELIKFEF